LAKRNNISWLALIACFFALGVICLGALTRLLDAGLGCPDWPGCYGHWVAPLHHPDSKFVAYKAWAEMIHRYFAGCLSILILVIISLIFKNAVMDKIVRKKNLHGLSYSKRYIPIPYDAIHGIESHDNPCKLFFAALVLLLLVVYQIILGQWTVTLKLLPVIVTQHLLGGFSILAVLWLIYCFVKPSFTLNHTTTLPELFWALIGLIILVLQITAGAWTSTHYASLSCPDFPLCFNDHWGWTTYRQTIQMMHRFGALIFVSYMGLLTAIFFKKIKETLYLFKLLCLIWGLLILQICLGITNIIFKLPLFTAVSHTLTAALLLLAMITFVYRLIGGVR
jgi:cytochrome c oxidase assembly protein subunit 15